MSDNAFVLLFATAFVLGLFALLGWLAWLDSPRQMRSITPDKTPKTPPRGTRPLHGHQPTKTVNRANPPKSGSAVQPPRTFPADPDFEWKRGEL